jgi:hypothetical protein
VKAILIYFGIFFGFYLFALLIKLVIYLKYSYKLNKLKTVLNKFNIPLLEHELIRLESKLHQSNKAWHMPFQDRDISIDDFIEADANFQKHNRSKPTIKKILEKRYRRYNVYL